MKIKYIKLKNFRSYKDEIKIAFDDFTAIIGKNDIGKSTILEALDIFFNDGNGVIKIDKGDINVEASRNGDVESIITVCFSELPQHIIIDSSVETSLADEYLLNSDQLLEIEKRYKNGGKASIFIKAKHPTNPSCNDLLLRKNADLKKVIKDNNIECDNQSINSVMRRAIWEYYSDDLNLQDTEIDASKEDAKAIWESLAPYMPVYSLFQSDRKNSDDDNEVQDPLKEAVKQIISDAEIQKRLKYVAEIVENKLREVSNRTLEKLSEMDSSIATSLNPVIPEAEKLKWNDVFKSVSISGDDDIPIRKRGSGVKRLVLLNFFRAEAERRVEEIGNTGIIYAIEEPETSQHFNNQRLLVNTLKELSQTDNTQVIITTHSPVIVKELQFDNLRMIYEENDNRCIRSIEPAILHYPSLNEVNYLAYGEVSEEYHNELYGFLDFHQWINDYKKGKPTRLYKQRDNRNGKIIEKQHDLTTYIRHQIHHPENDNNLHYTAEELQQSIEDMRNYIKERTAM